MNARPLSSANRIGLASAFAVLMALLLTAFPARASLIVKASTGTVLDNAPSWTGGAVPGAADVAVWNASSLGAGLSVGVGEYWQGILVTGAASDITIYGSGTIVPGTGGIDMSASPVNLFLSCYLLLGTNQTWNVNTGETLSVSGTINGGWNVSKNGGGTLLLSANNPMTGITTVNAGTVLISGQVHWNEGWHHYPALQINQGGTVLVSSGNANNFLGQCNYEASNNVIAGGLLEFATAGGAIEAIERAFAIGTNGGTIAVLNTNATLQFDYFSDLMQFSVPAAASMTLAGNGNGIMNKSITGYGGLVKDGGGTWTLNQTNTYTGPTLVTNGTLIINSTLWNSPVTVGPRATFGGAGVLIQSLTFQPGAQARFTNGPPATWNGPLTLNNNVVHLALPAQLPPGKYVLATLLAGAGVFNSIPVIDSGSLSNGCTATIQTGRGAVTLVVHGPPAPHLAIVSINDSNSVTAGLPFSVTVQAQDASGNPLTVNANTPVVLSLTSGYGSLAGNLTNSIPAGNSSIRFSGVTYTLDESNVVINAANAGGTLQAGDSAPFTVNLGPPATMTLLSDANSSGAPSQPLPNPIALKVTDPGGNAVPGATVTFNLAGVPAGAVGQALNVTNGITSADGTVSALLTLGSHPGNYLLTATLAGVPNNSLLITATATNSKWAQVWSDEFNYNGLPDSNRWNYEIGFVRNGEAQYYTSNRLQNACVTNGMAIITARKDLYVPPGQFSPAAGYTSASLITLGKESWTYGRIETRAKMPQPMGGVWNAFWMQGTNFPLVGWPLCGELDTVEYVNWDPNPHGNAFWGYNGGSVGQGYIYITPIPCYNDFHVYAVEWDSQQLNYYYDNTNYYTIYMGSAGAGTNNPFNNPQYILVNFALGGGWGGTIYDPGLPQQFLVDYVRVYQQPPTWVGAGSNGLWSTPANWTNSVAPPANARVVFAGGISANSFVDSALNQSGIAFYETAGSNTISATNGGTLVLNANGIANFSTNRQTLNVPIVLTTNEIFNANPGTLAIGGPISGSGGLNKVGPGTLTLGGTNTFTGGINVMAGTLALGPGGVSSNSTLTVTAGARLDLSGCGNFVPAGNALFASSSGGAPAFLSAGATNTISFGPVTLLYDGADPALYISQGVLSLSGNAFTVNSTSGQPLAPGTYPIIVQAAGSVRATGAFPAATGSAIGAGQTGLIVVSNNVVDLAVAKSSALSLNVPVLRGDGSVQLVFSGVNASLLYRVQASSRLNPAHWITLFTNVSGTNGLAAVLDTGATNIGQRFYRVVSP